MPALAAPSVNVIPEPVSRLLVQAGLAARQIRDGLRLEASRRAGVTKVLMSFTATSNDPRRLFATDHGRERPPPCTCDQGADGAAREPDHPWWGPKDAQGALRFAYTTAHYDFVEVWFVPGPDRVHVRVIT